MAIGGSRLISIAPWSNSSKSYDAARAAVYRPGLRLEWIAASIVQLDGHRFDRHRPGDHIYGSYNTFSKPLPGATLEPYPMAKLTRQVTGELGPAGDAAVYTIGLRWTGSLPGRFDYSAETAWQWGRWAADRVRGNAGGSRRTTGQPVPQ